MKVVVTGSTSDFGTVILPRLFADPEVESVLGIDLRPPRVDHDKLSFEEEDVRSPRIRELFEGADAVIHLAYVVAEIQDKQLTHDVNIGGSRNVLEAAADAGVARLVLASSVASYGVHDDLPTPITEEEFPRGNPDRYYFYDKAEVEHFVEWWLARHPESKTVVTRLRPAVIVGPHFSNPLLDLNARPVGLIPAEGARLQFLHEDALADAFMRCVKEDHPGPFNVAPEDSVGMDDVARMHGQQVLHLPAKAAGLLADVAFKLRLAPASSDWVGAGELQVDPARLVAETGWSPQFSSREAMAIHLLQNGRGLIGPAPELHRREVAEAALAPLTEILRGWCDSNPGLREAVGGSEEFDQLIAEAEHAHLPFRTGEIHAEIHSAEDASAPCIVFTPGMGAHVRFYSPALGALRRSGFNVIGWDRPGHGLSTGRRGDATMDETLDALELVIREARRRFGGPVVMGGSSLGGVITWAALTRRMDVEAAFCHNIAYGLLPHEPAAARKAPLLRAAARVAPRAPLPIGQIADFGEVASDAEFLRFFTDRQDGLWAWTLTLRSADSLATWRPQRDWAEVRTPTLVLVGEGDDMVKPSYMREVMAHSQPPGARMEALPGAGHLIFHEHLPQALEAVTGFVREALGTAAAA